MTWEIFSTNKDNPNGSPNLYVYKSETGEEVFSTIQKKQTDWEPCWSSDESVFGLMLGGEAFFYEINSETGFKTSAKKLGGGRNGSISISPGKTPHIAFYVPGTKGAPSMCKIFQYPAVTQAIACKSFFQADNVEMKWNKRGTGLLLLTSTEVDATGASYYGKMALHFLSTKGDSFAVQLKHEGPIHAVEWSPKSNEFCVVYGFMPANATVFNLKCDPVLEFEAAARNCIHYNDFGNLLILAGFGNLRGVVEIWDMTKKKQLTTLQAPDSTLLEWNPNGETFMTATCAPRLRIGNGFKIWHYSGALLHETLWQVGQELLDVVWQKYSEGIFKEPVISSIKIEGIKPSQAVASTQAYRPPMGRGTQNSSNLPDDSESKKSKIPGLPPGYESSKSSPGGRTNYSNRRGNDSSRGRGGGSGAGTKRNDNRRKGTPKTEKNESTDADPTVETEIVSPVASDAVTGSNGGETPKSKNNRREFTPKTTGDPEKDKKMRTINKKLHDIKKLKGRQDLGEKLESNQLVKIESEGSLLKELRLLKVT